MGVVKGVAKVTLKEALKSWHLRSGLIERENIPEF
jgi:uncharacterized protein YfaT (DUF1175 family)